MRTKVFAHKGVLGILSDVKAEGLFNDPTQRGQLGFVVDAAFVDVSPEALEILKGIPKSHDAIGDVDVYKADDGKVVFSWMGPDHYVLVPGSGASGSRTYDPSLITPVEGVEIDPEFINMVDQFKAAEEINSVEN